MDHRILHKSIRLPGYDCSQAGGYFVTICIQNRDCLLGEVTNGLFNPNIAGLMVESWWGQLTVKFPGLLLDAYVVMPNHFHGIVMLGACPTDDASVSHETGRHIGLPPQTTDVPDVAADLRVRPSQTAASQNPSLATVMQWFKTMTTNDYMRGVRTGDLPPFEKRLWQRNYYEPIIRDGTLDKIRAYIEGNPARWAEDEENPARIDAR